MRETNWSSETTFGGEGLTSRFTGKRIAATDHCHAVIKTCPHCFEKFVSTPAQLEHVCKEQ